MVPNETGIRILTYHLMNTDFDVQFRSAKNNPGAANAALTLTDFIDPDL